LTSMTDVVPSPPETICDGDHSSALSHGAALREERKTRQWRRGHREARTAICAIRRPRAGHFRIGAASARTIPATRLPHTIGRAVPGKLASR
jgi:hypothetical protein